MKTSAWIITEVELVPPKNNPFLGKESIIPGLSNTNNTVGTSRSAG